MRSDYTNRMYLGSDDFVRAEDDPGVSAPAPSRWRLAFRQGDRVRLDVNPAKAWLLSDAPPDGSEGEYEGPVGDPANKYHWVNWDDGTRSSVEKRDLKKVSMRKRAVEMTEEIARSAAAQAFDWDEFGRQVASAVGAEFKDAFVDSEGGVGIYFAAPLEDPQRVREVAWRLIRDNENSWMSRYAPEYVGSVGDEPGDVLLITRNAARRGLAMRKVADEVDLKSLYDEGIAAGKDERSAIEEALSLLTGGAFDALEGEQRERTIEKALRKVKYPPSPYNDAYMASSKAGRGDERLFGAVYEGDVSELRRIYEGQLALAGGDERAAMEGALSIVVGREFDALDEEARADLVERTLRGIRTAARRAVVAGMANYSEMDRLGIQLAVAAEWDVIETAESALGALEAAGSGLAAELELEFKPLMDEHASGEALDRSGEAYRRGHRAASGKSEAEAVAIAFGALQDANAHGEAAFLWDWLVSNGQVSTAATKLAADSGAVRFMLDKVRTLIADGVDPAQALDQVVQQYGLDAGDRQALAEQLPEFDIQDPNPRTSRRRRGSMRVSILNSSSDALAELKRMIGQMGEMPYVAAVSFLTDMGAGSETEASRVINQGVSNGSLGVVGGDEDGNGSSLVVKRAMRKLALDAEFHRHEHECPTCGSVEDCADDECLEAHDRQCARCASADEPERGPRDDAAAVGLAGKEGRRRVVRAYIVEQDGQYCVKSEEGKNLGCSDSREGAEKRLRQVEYFKHRDAAAKQDDRIGKCPNCGADETVLMPPDFETAKCYACERNFPVVQSEPQPESVRTAAGEHTTITWLDPETGEERTATGHLSPEGDVWSDAVRRKFPGALVLNADDGNTYGIPPDSIVSQSKRAAMDGVDWDMAGPDYGDPVPHKVTDPNEVPDIGAVFEEDLPEPEETGRSVEARFSPEFDAYNDHLVICPLCGAALREMDIRTMTEDEIRDHLCPDGQRLWDADEATKGKSARRVRAQDDDGESDDYDDDDAGRPATTRSSPEQIGDEPLPTDPIEKESDAMDPNWAREYRRGYRDGEAAQRAGTPYDEGPGLYDSNRENFEQYQGTEYVSGYTDGWNAARAGVSRSDEQVTGRTVVRAQDDFKSEGQDEREPDPDPYDSWADEQDERVDDAVRGMTPEQEAALSSDPKRVIDELSAKHGIEKRRWLIDKLDKTYNLSIPKDARRKLAGQFGPSDSGDWQYGVFDDEGNYTESTYECPECGGRDGAHEHDCPALNKESARDPRIRFLPSVSGPWTEATIVQVVGTDATKSEFFDSLDEALAAYPGLLEDFMGPMRGRTPSGEDALRFEDKSSNDLLSAGKKTADDDGAGVPPSELGVTIGDIFVSSWGYDQTNIDFYEVTAVGNKTMIVRQIASKSTPGQQWATSTEMPVPGQYTGEPMRKTLRDDGSGKPAFRVNSYSYAFKWDGNPQWSSSYASKRAATGGGHETGLRAAFDEDKVERDEDGKFVSNDNPLPWEDKAKEASTEGAYTYHVDLDERGMFRAHVDDPRGNEVFSLTNENDSMSEDDEFAPNPTGELWLVEDGFMRHSRDTEGLSDYLQEMGVIPRGASVVDGSRPTRGARVVAAFQRGDRVRLVKDLYGISSPTADPFSGDAGETHRTGVAFEVVGPGAGMADWEDPESAYVVRSNSGQLYQVPADSLEKVAGHFGESYPVKQGVTRDSAGEGKNFEVRPLDGLQQGLFAIIRLDNNLQVGVVDDPQLAQELADRYEANKGEPEWKPTDAARRVLATTAEEWLQRFDQMMRGQGASAEEMGVTLEVARDYAARNVAPETIADHLSGKYDMDENLGPNESQDDMGNIYTDDSAYGDDEVRSSRRVA